MEQTRYNRFDNIRFILIICVVFGHFLEMIPGAMSLYLYRIIYSFHMPAFIFISGYFAKYNREKILFTFLYTHLLFQIIYQLFERFILNPQQPFRFQFTYPYWLLWYLMAMILYYLLIPIFDDRRVYIRVLFVVVSIFLSILAGFDWTIQYYLSLSKFITFLPYFLAGYYARRSSKIQKFLHYDLKFYWCKSLLMLGVVCISCLYLWKNTAIIPAMLHGSNNYQLEGYEPMIKFILLIIGASWIIFFLVFPFLDKKIPFLTSIGQNTFPIFLLHGFCIKLAKKYEIFRFIPNENLLLAIILSFVIVIAFGNPYVGKIFQRVFTGNWILERMKKVDKHF